MYHVAVTLPQIVPYVAPKKVSVMEIVSGKMTSVSINKKQTLLVTHFIFCGLVFILDVRIMSPLCKNGDLPLTKSQ